MIVSTVGNKVTLQTLTPGRQRYLYINRKTLKLQSQSSLPAMSNLVLDLKEWSRLSYKISQPARGQVVAGRDFDYNRMPGYLERAVLRVTTASPSSSSSSSSSFETSPYRRRAEIMWVTNLYEQLAVRQSLAKVWDGRSAPPPSLQGSSKLLSPYLDPY